MSAAGSPAPPESATRILAESAPWTLARDALRGHGGTFATILLVSALATAVALAPPYLVKILVDDALLPRDAGVLPALLIALVALAVGGALLGVLNTWLHTRTSGRILFSLRESLYAHLAALSPRTRARYAEGDLLTRLDGDVAEIQRFALDSVLALASGVVGVALTVALLVSLSPTLAGLAALLLPVEWFFLRWIRPRLAERTRALRRDTAAVSSFFVETLPALKAIQATASVEQETSRLAGLHRNYLQDLLRAGLWNGGAAAGPRLLGALAQAVVFGVGGLAVIGGNLSVGSLLAFSAYLAQAGRPVQTLFGVYTAWARVKVSLERVGALTAETPEVATPPAPRTFPERSVDAPVGEIVFDEVCFAHTGTAPLLQRVSCKIPAGSTVRIRGASGAGKSTWVDLLARHYDPDSGVIRLDGIDLRALELRAVRRAVAVVGQGGVLFRGSLADNLRYGNGAVPDEDVRAAAEAAELGALLERDTRGGETIASGGRGLSGGEAQRVLLARAFLRSPRVLVLDEATSEVDEDIEAALLACVDRLFPDTTRILIGHHDSAARGATDLCFELDRARLRPCRNT